MQLYEQIESLNIIKSVFLSVAVSVFFSGVRTGLALRSKHNLVHNSAAVFWLDQLTGVASGLVAYAILHDWFGAVDKGLTHLAVIGVCAFSSAELLAVAKVGVVAGLRARLAGVLGVPHLEQKIEPLNEAKNGGEQNG